MWFDESQVGLQKLNFIQLRLVFVSAFRTQTCYITAKIRPRRYFVPVKLERVNESNFQIHQMNYIDGCPCPVVVN